MNLIFYLLYRLVLLIFAVIPYRLLYWMSDALAFVLYRVLRYRLNVVTDNINKCFPDKSTAERQAIIKANYSNLSDIMLESFKAPSINESEMRRRYPIDNYELINRLSTKHGGVIAIGAHYSNWEWGGISSGLHFNAHVFGLYKPLKNPYINRYINETRSQGGTTMVEFYKTNDLFDQRDEQEAIYVFVADQSPSNMRDAIWVDFFNCDTACLHGPEKYAKLTGYPVVYMLPERVGRGQYRVTLTHLDVPNDTLYKDGYITQWMMSHLEAYIKKSPGSWLWTHKRWKRRREEAQEQASRLQIKNKI